jgi:hypothetical protein
MKLSHSLEVPTLSLTVSPPIPTGGLLWCNQRPGLCKKMPLLEWKLPGPILPESEESYWELNSTTTVCHMSHVWWGQAQFLQELSQCRDTHLQTVSWPIQWCLLLNGYRSVCSLRLTRSQRSCVRCKMKTCPLPAPFKVTAEDWRLGSKPLVPGHTWLWLLHQNRHPSDSPFLWFNLPCCRM